MDMELFVQTMNILGYDNEELKKESKTTDNADMDCVSYYVNDYLNNLKKTLFEYDNVMDFEEIDRLMRKHGFYSESELLGNEENLRECIDNNSIAYTFNTNIFCGDCVDEYYFNIVFNVVESTDIDYALSSTVVEVENVEIL